jgi:4-aminobutyrate aminotransferase-like enzyme
MHIHPRKAFLQHLAQTSPNPMALHVVKAEGNYLFDENGKRYLDLIAGISVCNVGHQHPSVVSAVIEQAKAYMHVMVYGEQYKHPKVCMLRHWHRTYLNRFLAAIL